MAETNAAVQAGEPRPRWPRRVMMIALVAVFIVLGLRFAASVATYPTAPGFLLAQWRDPLVRPFGYQPAAFYRADRIKHARYWLDEAKHLARNEFASAEALMGGAWLLHNLTQQNTTASLQDELWNTSLELAALATQREPHNVDWWRLRARLAGTDRWSSLDDDWSGVFADAARHDPDNALYDYLTAYNVGWNTVRMAYAKGGANPFIVEWEKFDKSQPFIARGLDKPIMACPNNQIALVLDFLQQSRQPQFAVVDVCLHGCIDTFSYPSLGYVYELYQRRRGTAITADERVESCEWALRMVKQCEDGGTVDAMAARMKAEAITGLSAAALESPQGERDEPSDLQRALSAARSEETLAWKLLTASILPRGRAPYKQLVPIVAVQMVVRAIELVIFGALMLIVSSWIVGRRSEARRFGTARHLLAWIAGIGASVLILAVVPAQLLPDSVTTTVWSIVVFVPVAAALCVPLVLLRAQRGRRSGTPLAASLAIIAAVYGVGKWLRLDLQTMAASSRSLSRDPGLVDSILISNDPFHLQLALAQWDVWHGLLVGILISLALVAAWCAWRLTRRSRHGFRDLWFRKTFVGWAALCATLWRSLFGVAVCLLVIYLVIAPSAVREVDVACQILEKSLRGVELKPAVVEAIAKARGNPAELDRLIKMVDQGQLELIDSRAPAQPPQTAAAVEEE